MDEDSLCLPPPPPPPPLQSHHPYNYTVVNWKPTISHQYVGDTLNKETAKRLEKGTKSNGTSSCMLSI